MNLMPAILILLAQTDGLDRTISVDFDGVPLEDALQTVRAQLGANLTIDPAARDEHGGVPVSMKLKDVSVRTVLKIMLDERELTLTRRDGVLVVVTKASIADRVVTKVYDVRDLIHAPPHFAGPSMALSNPEDSLIGTILTMPEEDPSPKFPGDALDGRRELDRERAREDRDRQQPAGRHADRGDAEGGWGPSEVAPAVQVGFLVLWFEVDRSG